MVLKLKIINKPVYPRTDYNGRIFIINNSLFKIKDPSILKYKNPIITILNLILNY